MVEEISLSVEETNALRASLGLKPLRMDTGPKSEKHTDEVPDEKIPELTSKQAKITKQEEENLDGKRLLSELTAGGSILDGSDDEDGASSWLSRLSKKQKSKSPPVSKDTISEESKEGESPSDKAETPKHDASLISDSSGAPPDATATV